MEQRHQPGAQENRADAGHPGADCGDCRAGQRQQNEDAEEAEQEANAPCHLVIELAHIGEQKNAVEGRGKNAHGTGEKDQYAFEDGHL